MQRAIPYMRIAVFLFACALLYSKSAYASCTPPSSGWNNATTLLAQITLLCLAGTLIKRRKLIIENRRVYYAFSAALISTFVAYIAFFHGYLEKTFPIDAYTRSYKDDHFFLERDYNNVISRLHTDVAALLATAGLLFLSRYKMLRSAGGLLLVLLFTGGILIGSLGSAISSIPHKLSPPCCHKRIERSHPYFSMTCPVRTPLGQKCKACAVDLLREQEKEEARPNTSQPIPRNQ